MGDGDLDHIDLGRSRDLQGRNVGPWVRRAAMTLLAIGLLLALLNVFGQKQTTSRAAGNLASVRLVAPAALRGGLIYQAHVIIVAGTTPVASPKLVLGRGWFDGLTVNTIEPAPSSEVARNGSIVLAYDRLDSGRRMDVYIEGQVNPTTVGGSNWDLELDDGTLVVARLHRHLRVFP